MIGFIGGGNMAEALIQGVASKGVRDILVAEPRDERRRYLDKELRRAYDRLEQRGRRFMHAHRPRG